MKRPCGLGGDVSPPKPSTTDGRGNLTLFARRCYLARNSRIALAISAACVSSAKCPVSKKRTTAFGISRLNASAPGGRKNGSFLPHAARKGGLCVRKYF